MPSEEEFDVSLRSLLVWPIDGQTEEELRSNFEGFVSGALCLSASNLGEYTIARERSAPKARAYLMVSVTLASKHVRDDVFSLGPDLAGFRDIENKPTCGLSLHIPAKLMPSFKTLENFAFYLRKKNQGNVKTHIKFDTYGRTLFLQARHVNDDEWSNFTVEQARQELSEKNTRKAFQDTYGTVYW